MKPVGKKQVIQMVSTGAFFIATMLALMGGQCTEQSATTSRPEPANTGEQSQPEFKEWELPWYYFGDIYTLLRGRCGHDYLINALVQKSNTEIEAILRNEGRADTTDSMLIGMVRTIIENDRPLAKKDKKYWWLTDEPYPWDETRAFPVRIKVRHMDPNEMIITPTAILIPKDFRTDSGDNVELHERMQGMNFKPLGQNEYKPGRDLSSSVFRILESMSLDYTKYFALRDSAERVEEVELYKSYFKPLFVGTNDERRDAIERYADDKKHLDLELPSQMTIQVHANKASHLTSIRAVSKDTLVLNFCLTYTTHYWPPNHASLTADSLRAIDPGTFEPVQDVWAHGGFGLICDPD